MSRLQRNRARLALVLVLGVAAYVALPLAPFLIGGVFLLLVTALAFAAHWYEQAVEVEAENFSLLIAAAGLEADCRELTREHEALLTRLSEVLDEHALCPAPTTEIIVQPVDIRAVERGLRKLSRVRGDFPEQRGPGATS